MELYVISIFFYNRWKVGVSWKSYVLVWSGREDGVYVVFKDILYYYLKVKILESCW